MELQNYQSLFAQIIGLNERYKNIDEVTGENFNILRILKLESSEVRMHSALIAELLNPRGSHGQKDVFLQIFIDKFCKTDFLVDATSSVVNLEKHTGYLATDKLSGGRLDIFIHDKFGHHIIIENKIFAGDQENQLVRYYNYSKDATILYLTLDGRLPNERSYGNLDPEKHFKCISYETDIISWLESCRKEVAILPTLRESITQYINLIKYLTNQTPNHAMQEDISNIIRSNMQASILIADNIKNAQAQIISEFGRSLENEIKTRGLDLSYDLNLRKRFNGFYVSKPLWRELRIVFQFQTNDNELVYGIAATQDPLIKPVSTELRAKVELIPNNYERGNTWWPWLQLMEKPYDNWHNHEVWQAIGNGEMLRNVLSKIDTLIKHIGDIKL